jgi:hypothetical protein
LAIANNRCKKRGRGKFYRLAVYESTSTEKLLLDLEGELSENLDKHKCSLHDIKKKTKLLTDPLQVNNRHTSYKFYHP